MIETRVLTGGDLRDALPQLAQLRIAVFAEWPYLYDGDDANERRYLAAYETARAGLLIASFDGDTIIGAATGMALTDHDDTGSLTLPVNGPRKDQMFYCAESVLLPAYRGQGLGHLYFDERERFAVQNGFTHSGFLSVMRPDTHPLRPNTPRTHSAFWSGRGYVPVDGATAEMTWTDINTSDPSSKTLQFWMRSL
jgi:GNAT superfamily N-acetyltransferase